MAVGSFCDLRSSFPDYFSSVVAGTSLDGPIRAVGAFIHAGKNGFRVARSIFARLYYCRQYYPHFREDLICGGEIMNSRRTVAAILVQRFLI
jgi:hypothetical protein